MAKFLGFELLTANALIHEIEHNGKRYITVDHAHEYARRVSNNLTQKGVANIVLYDSDRFEDCRQDFIANSTTGAVIVNDGVSAEDLRDKYRAMLSYEVVAACVEVEKELDEKAIENGKKIGNVYDVEKVK